MIQASSSENPLTLYKNNDNNSIYFSITIQLACKNKQHNNTKLF